MNSYFKTDNLNEFISQLHTLTNIDCDIIRNLITLNLLDDILNKNSILIKDNFYIIFFKEFGLIPNYELTEVFIFASYSLYNNNFQVVNFDNSQEIHKHKLINKNSKKLNFLTIYFRNQLTLCDLLMKVDLQDYSEHSVDILSIYEKENLRLYIIDKFCDLGYISSIYNQHNIKESSFIYPVKSVLSGLNQPFSHDEAMNYISSYINKALDQYYQNINHIKNTHRSTIFSFFERALLDEEMKTF